MIIPASENDDTSQVETHLTAFNSRLRVTEFESNKRQGLSLMKNGVVGDSEAISMHTATLGTNTGSAQTMNTGSALKKLTVDR